MLRRLLYGLSCRDYRACAEAVPEAFGLSRSSLSRRYIQATARKPQALQERRLDGYDFVALVLDGKAFAEDTLVTALGLTLQGDKIILGFVQTGTENATACTDFLRQLVGRGLRYEDGLLIVIDGSKGLRAGVEQVFGSETPVQRCAYHMRDSILFQSRWTSSASSPTSRGGYPCSNDSLRRQGRFRKLRNALTPPTQPPSSSTLASVR